MENNLNSQIKSFFDNFSYQNKEDDLFYNGLGSRTESILVKIDGKNIPCYINEFWTSKQRKSNSIHEISYRACFKAELPNFFINLLTKKGDVVYDPFSGRGTTAIEAALLKRKIIANDINPISKILLESRLNVPTISEIRIRLDQISFDKNLSSDIDLTMFYEKNTLREILNLRSYLKNKSDLGVEDNIDKWIRMVATNRLSGHSAGFFSVYTLPPNQAISASRQVDINAKRNQKPEYRDVRNIILKKSKSLIKDLNLSNINDLKCAGREALLLLEKSFNTPQIADNLVDLIITSPPFLDVIDYAGDNWLRCWFNMVDFANIEKNITTHSKIENWCDFIEKSFVEFDRILKPKGYIAFEVGEVRNGKVNLEEHAAKIGMRTGFECVAIVINNQKFTKTANIWGVENNKKGTNSNRIILFQKI